MAEAIAITSGKGGVGKSSICVNLGMVLAQMGYRVCLIDVDLGLKNLDIMLGLENRVIYDLNDVMKGRCTLNKALINDKREERLSLLPACKSVHIEQFDGDSLGIVVEELKKSFDYILLDTPAGIESGFIHAIHCVDEAVLVTTPDITAVQDCDRVIGILLKEGIGKLSVVINRVNTRYIEKGVSISLEDVKSWLSIDLLGYVFDDPNMIAGNNRGKPISLKRDSSLYLCFEIIAKRFLGQKIGLPKIKDRTFLQKLFG